MWWTVNVGTVEDVSLFFGKDAGRHGNGNKTKDQLYENLKEKLISIFCLKNRGSIWNSARESRHVRLNLNKSTTIPTAKFALISKGFERYITLCDYLTIVIINLIKLNNDITLCNIQIVGKL